jgi:imidazole glycerol-phosphate synthase subunit HisF
MFAKRIIPCLDCKDGRVVKGVQFVNLRDAGDPGELAEMYNREGADELVMLDISASHEGRATLMDTVNRVARKLFIPLTVGGGVRRLDDARRLLASGADKVAVNTGAVETPELICELAARYGRQAVVIAIDARRIRNSKSENRNVPEASPRVSGNPPGDPKAIPERTYESQDASLRHTAASPRWTVLTYGGRRETGLDALEWARRVEALGAGEILLTSMDADGTQAGFDCELTRTTAQAVHIPVIASGGAGAPEHIAEVFLRGAADAALAASIFHFATHTIRSLKEYLRAQGVPVRL